MVFHIAMTQI